MKTRAVWYGWILISLLAAGLIAFPIRSTGIRIAIASLLALAWMGLCALLWRGNFRGPAFAVFLVPMFAGCWVAFAPARPLPVAELRDAYLARLAHYDGTPYVWGGETPLGLDCSGLFRRALQDALMQVGVRHANAGAMRDAFWLWAHDASARSLGEGAGGVTISLAPRALRPADFAAVQPGDMAITTAGLHVYAFLGNARWIEAEPTIGRTHIFPLGGDFQYVADSPVRFVRWKWFFEQ